MDITSKVIDRYTWGCDFAPFSSWRSHRCVAQRCPRSAYTAHGYCRRLCTGQADLLRDRDGAFHLRFFILKNIYLIIRSRFSPVEIGPTGPRRCVFQRIMCPRGHGGSPAGHSALDRHNPRMPVLAGIHRPPLRNARSRLLPEKLFGY